MVHLGFVTSEVVSASLDSVQCRGHEMEQVSCDAQKTWFMAQSFQMHFFFYNDLIRIISNGLIQLKDYIWFIQRNMIYD